MAACKPGVLVFGPAGVGKSYLTAFVAHSLCKTYSTQSWLSCSAPLHLQQDVSLSSDFERLSKDYSTYASLPNDASNVAMALPTGNTDSDSLVVFDDVFVSTARRVVELITSSYSSVIITTKSPAVKQFLLLMLPDLHVVELKPFLPQESQELLSRKVNLSTRNEFTRDTIDRVLCGALGNLPLGVSIYSSLLAVSLRKPERTTFNVLDERLVIDNWEEIEERFGDRFHVRGFTGIVQSAESYLKEFPLVMFLLAKICLANSESLPWDVVQRSSMVYSIEHRFSGQQSQHLVSGILGVSDWLFSDPGAESLKICRHALEELALVRWEESTSTVNIHCLTLKCAQKMLEANRFFMGDLLILIPESRFVDGATSLTGEEVSVHFANELFANILSTCQQILSEATLGSEENHLRNLERSYPAFKIFERLLEGSMGPNPPKIWTWGNWQRGALAMSLLAYALWFNLSVADRQWRLLLLDAKIISSMNTCKSSLSEYERSLPVALISGQLFEEGLYKEAQESFKSLLKLQEVVFGEQADAAALTHCHIAICIEGEAGQPARKAYLQEASGKCPQLVMPDAHVMDKELSDGEIYETECERYYFCSTRIEVWLNLVYFRIDDQMHDTGKVDRETLEAAHVLINAFQQKQRVALERAGQVQCLPNCGLRLWKAGQLNQWMLAVGDEGALWLKMQQHGHFLRMVAKQFLPVIEASIQSGSVLLRGQLDCITWVEMFLTGLIRSCLVVGHFSLAEELCYKLADSRPNTPTSSQNAVPAIVITFSNGSYQKETAASKQNDSLLCWTVFCIKVASQLAKWIRLVHQNLDLEIALDSLSTLFEKSFRHQVLTGLGEIALNYIVCLSSLLGGAVGHRVLAAARAWVDNITTCSSWKHHLQKAAREICSSLEQSELISICNDFLESRKALVLNDYISAHFFSMKCLRAISAFFKNPLNIWPHTQEFEASIASMLLELAGYLQRCYAKNGNIKLVERLFHFRFHTARRARLCFSAAKIGIKYIKFLKASGRRTEAAEQCRLVQNMLVEQFGEDYVEWLPNTPRPGKILQDLELISDEDTRDDKKTGEEQCDK